MGEAFWNAPAEGVLAGLQAQPDGLTSTEAAARRSRFGANVTAGGLRQWLGARIVRRFAEPLIAMLLIAAFVSGATGDWQSCLVIVTIVLLSIGLDVAQERRAAVAVDALKRSVAVTARVRRDGTSAEIPAADIVPGDVIELSAGDLVPADGIVLTARGALVDEAILTGEPYGVEKRRGACVATAPGEAFNALFAGTSLVGGEATMLAVAIGGTTRFGAIAASIREKAVPTAFERGIHALGMLILRLTGFLVLVVLMAQMLRHGLTLESFLFAVALAVGLTPELLPMIMTVTLSRGAVRMAGQRVVVKRLSAIHDLGSMDVLCTDKTGTLTEAKIALVGSFGPNGADQPRVARLAWLNSQYASAMRSSLDEAILAGAAPAEGVWRRIDDAPFDFERRRASVLVGCGERRLMITKGAPEGTLTLCSRVEMAEGRMEPLDTALIEQLAALFDAKGREGYRLLGVAWKEMPAGCVAISPADEEDLIFAGCVAFLDPPKASAGAAVARLAAAGIRVKIVSGDAEPVVRHLVEMLALPTRGVLSGDELAGLGDAALAARAEEADLFVRVAPDQKSRIVRALRRRGHTVGYLGDGINDAPAIHAADVGLSVDSGTDVARETADIILLAPDLGVLADGVAEGRRTYANIMKYVRMGTSSNFGNMLSMAAASLVLPFLPLAPLQILLNNLLYDLSEIGIPFDAADPEATARPHGWDMRDVLRFTLVMGPLSSLFDLATFALLGLVFRVDVASFRTAWFVESIATQILVIFIIRTARQSWKSWPHPVLAASSLGALFAALAVALTPAGGLFGFATVPLPVLGAVAILSLFYLAMAESLKRIAVRPRPI